MKESTKPEAATNNIRVDSNSIFAGMQPAFQHAVTGEAHLAQLADGSVANEYSFASLPDYWVAKRDSTGLAIELCSEVIPGYWFNGRFFSFAQLSKMPLAA